VAVQNSGCGGAERRVRVRRRRLGSIWEEDEEEDRAVKSQVYPQ
jgi:hypothetical protein